MFSARDRALTTVDTLADFGQRSATNVTARLRRVRASLLLILQSGVAAGISWYIAHDVIKHPAPFFAPISAVIVLGVAVGQRWRRAAEVAFGVALGLAIADLLLFVIGSGPWQLGLVVMLAMSAAVFLGGSPTVIGQTASSAVLVATLTPGHFYYARFIDALVGGGVGLVVMTLLLPLNPLTTVQRAARPALDLLSSELSGAADALATRDIELARTTLVRLRGTDPRLNGLRDSINVATETASLAPVRWRSRAPLALYVDAAVHIDRAVRNARVLVRRSVSALDDNEQIPPDLPEALRTLSGAVSALKSELAAGREPKQTRIEALAAVAQASDAHRAGTGFSGNVVVAQIRSTALDLLRATGLDESTSTRAVRRAVGRLTA
jgi:uncharacterized membrane protein YgaE (UPF0421/DUF939 family)